MERAERKKYRRGAGYEGLGVKKEGKSQEEAVHSGEGSLRAEPSASSAARTSRETRLNRLSATPPVSRLRRGRIKLLTVENKAEEKESFPPPSRVFTINHAREIQIAERGRTLHLHGSVPASRIFLFFFCLFALSFLEGEIITDYWPPNEEIPGGNVHAYNEI